MTTKMTYYYDDIFVVYVTSVETFKNFFSIYIPSKNIFMRVKNPSKTGRKHVWVYQGITTRSAQKKNNVPHAPREKLIVVGEKFHRYGCVASYSAKFSVQAVSATTAALNPIPTLVLEDSSKHLPNVEGKMVRSNFLNMLILIFRKNRLSMETITVA